MSCNLFPYGRFNSTSTNLKLFPKVNNRKLPDAEKVDGSTSMMVQATDGTYVQICCPILYRDVSTINPSRPGSRVAGNVFSNTSHGLSRAEKISLLSKFKMR